MAGKVRSTANKAMSVDTLKPHALKEQYESLRNSRRWRDQVRPIMWIIVILAVVGFFANKASPDKAFPWTGLLLGLLVGSICSFMIDSCYFRDPRKEDIQELQQRIELLEDMPEWQRAERLFKLHQIELKRYYDQALSQSKWIFYVGLACLLLGFLIIWGAYEIVVGKEVLVKENQKIVIAVVGAIGGLLSSYIASIYMKMYTESLRSLTDFHNRLVKTHHMHYGAYLAARIMDDHDLMNETFSKMAIGTVPSGVEADDGSANDAGENKSSSDESISELLKKILDRLPEKE
jgi:hypothetical protein